MIQPLSFVFVVLEVAAVSRTPRCCWSPTVADHGPAEYVPLAPHSDGLLLKPETAALDLVSFALNATRKSKPPNFGDQYCTLFAARRWNDVPLPSTWPHTAVVGAAVPTPVTVPPAWVRLSQFSAGLLPVLSPLAIAGPLCPGRPPTTAMPVMPPTDTLYGVSHRPSRTVPQPLVRPTAVLRLPNANALGLFWRPSPMPFSAWNQARMPPPRFSSPRKPIREDW